MKGFERADVKTYVNIWWEWRERKSAGNRDAVKKFLLQTSFCRKVVFGIWLKHHEKFEFLNFPRCLKAKFQISPLCRRMFDINTTIWKELGACRAVRSKDRAALGDHSPQTTGSRVTVLGTRMTLIHSNHRQHQHRHIFIPVNLKMETFWHRNQMFVSLSVTDWLTNWLTPV